MSLLKKVMSVATMAIAFITNASWASDAAELSKYNLRPGVTENSVRVYELHNEVAWIMLAVAFLVFAAIFYAAIKFRKSKNPEPAKFSHSTTLEIIWTVIPILILAYLAKPAIALLLDMEDTSKSDMTVKVTGIQWKWKYTYLDEGIEFISSLSTPPEQFQDYERTGTDKGENYLLEVDNELVLPVGKKIRFLMTADDVIHSWWVPDFAVKMDTIPGFINETWTRIEEPGVYRGVCAELCGRNHGFMPIVVRAVEQQEYDQWVQTKLEEKAEAARLAAEAAAKSWSMDDLMELGKQVYDVQCSMCHQPDGQGIATFPALAGSKIAIESDYIGEHIDIVLYGKGQMSKFGDKLTDAEIAAVVTYERNAWGNDTGDLIQPGDIADRRAGN